MKAVAAREPARSLEVAACWPRLATAALLPLAAFGALGDELPSPTLDSSAATPAGAARSRLELSSSTVPLFENLDGATRASRVDLTWMPPRTPSLGLALGLTSFEGPGLKAPGGSPAPAVDLGIHWRPALDSQYRLDVTAWRRMAPADAISLVQNREPSYGARFEMQIGSAPSAGLVAARGFLGLQLEGGGRITVRRSHGRPMVYYRSKF